MHSSYDLMMLVQKVIVVADITSSGVQFMGKPSYPLAVPWLFRDFSTTTLEIITPAPPCLINEMRVLVWNDWAHLRAGGQTEAVLRTATMEQEVNSFAERDVNTMDRIPL
jgi:hypothetical protein